MLEITKSEAFAMRKQLGAVNVKKSYSKNPKYYLVESNKNIKCLTQYRKERVLFDSSL